MGTFVFIQVVKETKYTQPKEGVYQSLVQIR